MTRDDRTPPRTTAEQRRKAAALRAAADRSRRATEKARLRAVAEVIEGRTVRAVAKEIGATETAIYSWMKRYHETGRMGLAQRPLEAPRPRLGRLDDATRTTIAATLDAAPILDGKKNWTMRDLRDWLARNAGVDIPVNRLGDEVRALGYRKLPLGSENRTRWVRTE